MACWQVARTQQVANTRLGDTGKDGHTLGFAAKLHGQKLSRQHDYVNYLIADPCLQQSLLTS